MNAPVQEWTVDNAAWAAAKPRLSVLVPFLHDDPRRLLAALDREAAALQGQVEIVLLDDGAEDDGLAADVAAAVNQAGAPARFVQILANEGRAKGRNRLARNARAPHLLFLDADMLPDAPDFLARYLALIEAQNPAVVFGGFSVRQAPRRREHALHRKLALRSDCAPAAVRRRTPEKYVFTSNLLARRDVFETEPFDEAFKGWGWEDVEWGVRVSRAHKILHIDNPATHLGLDSARVIAAKYEQSAANFAYIARLHPDVVRRFPSYKAARLMKLAPFGDALRPALKLLALADPAPVGLRAFSMRLYRAAVCARAL
ncbi:MAG: glycosyltransferase [Caulobacteraceae bacterium]